MEQNQLNEQKEKKPNYTLRKIVAGTIFLGAMYGLFGFSNSKPEPKKTEPQTKIAQIQKHVELSDIVKYKKENPEKFSNLINSGDINDYIQSNPEEANKVYNTVWNFMSSNKIKLNNENFLLAFKYFRKELEKNPDLSDNLGDNVKSYQKRKMLKQYLNGLGFAVKNIAEEGYNVIKGGKQK